MSHQERSAEHHLERALRIKQDIASNYDTAHGIWQDEKQARHLLQEHIRTITDVVRKITSDIQVRSPYGCSRNKINYFRTV